MPQDNGPWTKYAAQGPWTKYAPSTPAGSPTDDLEALRQRSMQQAHDVSAAPVQAYEKSPQYVYSSEGPAGQGQFQPHDPGDAVLRLGTLPQKIHRAIGNVAENLAPVAAPLAVTAPVALATSAAGGEAGSLAGKYGSEMLGVPSDWADVAGDAGGLAGSYGGYRLGTIAPENVPRFMRDPATEEQSLHGLPGTVRAPKLIRDWAIPDWAVPRGELGTPTNPGPFREFLGRNADIPQIQSELGSPENPGWMVRLPSRMPVPKPPESELGSPENPGWVVNLPNRMPRLGSLDNPDLDVTGPSGQRLGRRLSPLIYENEAQANQVDALNARLGEEARKAGMYSAARGKV